MYHAIIFDDLKLLLGFVAVILATGGALIGFVNLVHFYAKKARQWPPPLTCKINKF
ncbi:hypothetical protein WOSG25_250060 [Weissella oryzae SG25]|uniref:Uncharacterized protein n=1 Tax=Weissella oryzae (strain DSM 25784 / JCM 18191 / LMG 30913 / SG25) TaxID=1329250 RepID=A0A069CW54_WEIOS|nr:hypothetical protein [Weissella oryzae]GAK32035.1 hypothetical protein WOSG25_250060 [Weissella oryzae SG25]